MMTMITAMTYGSLRRSALKGLIRPQGILQHFRCYVWCLWSVSSWRRSLGLPSNALKGTIRRRHPRHRLLLSMKIFVGDVRLNIVAFAKILRAECVTFVWKATSSERSPGSVFSASLKERLALLVKTIGSALNVLQILLWENIQERMANHRLSASPAQPMTDATLVETTSAWAVFQVTSWQMMELVTSAKLHKMDASSATTCILAKNAHLWAFFLTQSQINADATRPRATHGTSTN